MVLALHKNARTTPAVRREIARSSEPAAALAARCGITEPKRQVTYERLLRPQP